MLKNYIKTALRSFRKNKAYSAINTFGLTIGLTCSLFILLFINDELSFDKHHENADRIYRVTGQYDRGAENKVESAVVTYQLAPMLKEVFPQFEQVARVDWNNIDVINRDNELFREQEIVYADNSFFDVFSLTTLAGNEATFLDETNEAVITASMAEKYFGGVDPVGEFLQVGINTVRIEGVIEDIPANSHFRANIIISQETIHDQYPQWIRTNWGGTSHYAYVLLKEGIDAAEMEESLNAYWTENAEDYVSATTFSLQPLTDIHLRSQLRGEAEANGDIAYVYIFGIVALVILLIAAINYMNLATAQSITRTSEVGVRKVLGANSLQVKGQFLSESIMISLAAFMISLFAVELFMDMFNVLTGKTLSLSISNDYLIIAGVFLLTIIIGVGSGSYPSLWLSRLGVIKVLKSKHVQAGSGNVWFRKGLVFFQFAISAAVLISTLLVYQQVQFMQDKKLGINPEQVIVVPFQSQEVAQNYETMKQELLSHSEISMVSATNNALPGRIGNWREYRLENTEEPVGMPTIIVHNDFIETLDAEIIVGRSFEKDRATDQTQAYVVNEAAVKFLGLENPVGTKITGRAFTGSVWSSKEAEIIGVVKDYHFTSLHDEIQPTIFSLYSEQTTPINVMAVRVNDIEKGIEALQATWGQFTDAYPLVYSFMDDSVAQLYESEQRFLQVFSISAFMAIMISCLGILGLVAFALNQKMKEIGIRKVLGANANQIVWLFARNYTILIVLANVLAWPVAYLLMRDWLERFAYSISIGLVEFILGGIIIFGIALTTICIQAYRAAFMNPVDSLKTE